MQRRHNRGAKGRQPGSIRLSWDLTLTTENTMTTTTTTTTFKKIVLGGLIVEQKIGHVDAESAQSWIDACVVDTSKNGHIKGSHKIHRI
jgi:hypothetical protein